MANLTRRANFSEKKATCALGAANIVYSILDSKAAAAGNDILFNLPPECLVTRAYLIVNSAANAGATFDLDLVIGAVATVLLNDASSDTVGVVKSGSLAVDSSTGANIRLTSNIALTQGEFSITVEYIEYNKGTREYNNID